MRRIDLGLAITIALGIVVALFVMGLLRRKMATRQAARNGG